MRGSWILTFQAKRIRCVWGKSFFSGIHTSWVKVLRSKFKASGVGDGGAGSGSPTPKFLIWWKSGKNPLKSGQNLCKFGQNVWKPSQNHFICFDFTKMAPEIKVQTFLFLEVMFLRFFFRQVRGNLGKILAKMVSEVLWFDKMRPKWNEMQSFLRSFSFFRVGFGKFGQNPSHPQKFACSYTYERLWAFRACTDCKR